MDSLYIESSRDTLEISCNADSGIIQMHGVSYPQDAADFFSPVFDWLDNYIEQKESAVLLNLRINYVNTSSTKCLFDLIDRMEEYFESGGEAKITWYYENDDEDIRETGLEFKEDVALPFEMIAY